MTLTEAQALLDTLAAETGADHVVITRSYVPSVGRVVYMFSTHTDGLVRTGHAQSLDAAHDIALAAEPFDARKAIEGVAA